MRAVRNNPVRLQQKKNGSAVFRLSTSYKIPSSAQLATSAKREVPRAGIAERLRSQSAHKCRALCPHKELQSAFIPFITSERMRYESLRADKRKTARPFFDSRLPIRFRAVRNNPVRLQQKKNGLAVFRLPTSYKIPSSGRSRCIRAPLTTVFLHSKNTQPFCQNTTRHPCRALNEREARSSPRDLQRARSAKFPAQELPSVSNKRKTARPFFDSRLPIRFRAVAVRGFPKTSVFGKFP